MTTASSDNSDMNRVKRVLQAFFDTHRVGHGLPDAQRVDVMRMWLSAVADLPVGDVLVAVNRFNAECHDFPTPARLREYAPNGAAMTDERRAMACWGSVIEAVRRLGAYRTVDFADRLANAAIRQMGGWTTLCAATTEQMTWKAKEFCAAYVACARSGVGNGSPLLGIVDQENKGEGDSPIHRIESRLPAHAMAGRLEYRASVRMTAIDVVRQLSGHLGVAGDANEPVTESNAEDTAGKGIVDRRVE